MSKKQGAPFAWDLYRGVTRDEEGEDILTFKQLQSAMTKSAGGRHRDFIEAVSRMQRVRAAPVPLNPEPE